MSGPDEPQAPGPGQPPPGGFQGGLEAIEGYHGFRDIPAPVNPLQAQSEFERRASREDWVAHIIAIIIVMGFFIMALAGLLGFVDLTQPTVATAFGTIVGFAVGKTDPVLTRYFITRAHQLMPQPDGRSTSERGQQG